MVPSPIILVFTDYYLPGYKAGGPVRTLSNMIKRLADRYSFTVITRDRDLGDREAYSKNYVDAKVAIDNAFTLFLPPSKQSFSFIRQVMCSSQHDLLYLNSFFSFNFTIKPLLLRRIGLVPLKPVILAPRGEFSPAAMNIRGLKKRIFLKFAKLTGIYKEIVWQASSRHEVEDILRTWCADARVVIAPDLSTEISAPLPDIRTVKKPGSLHAVFLSRISKIKNLDFALKLLGGLTGQVQLDIFGPIEDAGYWKRCLGVIESLPDTITVRYCGEIPNDQVAELMNRYHLFILPTKGENYGHAIIESLSSGCPVLISDRTPWRGLREQGVGWDVPLESFAMFKAILQDCINMNHDAFTECSLRARAYGTSPDRNREAVALNYKLFDSVLCFPSAGSEEGNPQ